MAQQITTSEVRLSYVTVFVPRADQSKKLKYSVTCLLPKTDTVGYNQLMQAIQTEAQAEASGKLKGVSIQHVKHPIHDGDGVTQNGTPFGDECKGHWVFTATASEDRPPQVVDQRVQPIQDKSQIYSGCYGHVALSIYAYDNQSKGIGFGLNGLQKTRDGEALGFSFDAQKAFTAVATPSIDPITGQAVATPSIDPITGQPI